MDEKYFPQVYLEECKYKMKNLSMLNYIQSQSQIQLMIKMMIRMMIQVMILILMLSKIILIKKFKSILDGLIEMKAQ